MSIDHVLPSAICVKKNQSVLCHPSDVLCGLLQILSYLVACDRLCEQGYDEAQVEEALEMFQNCETKVSKHIRESSTR